MISREKYESMVYNFLEDTSVLQRDSRETVALMTLDAYECASRIDVIPSRSAYGKLCGYRIGIVCNPDQNMREKGIVAALVGCEPGQREVRINGMYAVSSIFDGCGGISEYKMVDGSTGEFVFTGMLVGFDDDPRHDKKIRLIGFDEVLRCDKGTRYEDYIRPAWNPQIWYSYDYKTEKYKIVCEDYFKETNPGKWIGDQIPKETKVSNDNTEGNNALDEFLDSFLVTGE